MEKCGGLLSRTVNVRVGFTMFVALEVVMSCYVQYAGGSLQNECGPSLFILHMKILFIIYIAAACIRAILDIVHA